MHYLIPDTGNTDEIVAVTSRATIPLHNPKNIRDFILMTQTDPISVVAVSEDLMLILARHASSVFPNELPIVLNSVPGLLYQAGWASMGTAFPPEHFRNFAEATKRSGVLSTTSLDLESRGKGAMVLDSHEPSAMVEGFPLPESEDVHDEAES